MAAAICAMAIYVASRRINDVAYNEDWPILLGLIFLLRPRPRHTLQMHSIDDTLVGFATGIAATGGRRFNALSGAISSNRVELNLHGTRLQTTTVDLRLSGATTMLGVSTGDDNTAHVLLGQATGSGARANRYAHSSTPPMGSPGIGNRLEIVGNANAFDQTNQHFVPPPPAEFFTGTDGWSASSFKFVHLRYSLTTGLFIGKQQGGGTLVLGESGDEFTTECSTAGFDTNGNPTGTSCSNSVGTRFKLE